jgi:23S rRNA (guanine745-N1)-methyltransferase
MVCPRCRGSLGVEGGSLRCSAGHTFDIAREGYVSMVAGTGAGAAADTVAMVAARRRSLDAGHLQPVTDALVDAADDAMVGVGGMVVDVGGGTGHHLAAVLDALPEADGLVVDLSREAARVAARANPRMSVVVCDIRRGLPLRDGVVSLLLDVFAPREGAEMRRVIQPDGRLLVVTPGPAHLLELADIPGMLRVDEHKQERLERSLGSWFRLGGQRAVEWRMRLDRAAVGDLVSMGPSAHHVAPDALSDALTAFPDPMDVTGAVDLWVWSPR